MPSKNAESKSGKAKGNGKADAKANGKPKKGKASGTPRRRRGVKLRPTELGPLELRLEEPPAELQTLSDQVTADGGAVLAAYREPLGGHALLLAALPIELVVPTPFQRDLSDAHVRRLTQAMDKTKRFLDPVIAVRDEAAFAADAELADPDEEEAPAPGQRRPCYWVPNGYHRLTALKELGAKTLLALLVPEPDVAYQILALNIEKPHNLREKALGVVRMYHNLLDRKGFRRVGEDTEEGRSLEFEEPALATLGFAYEERPRLSGGAYHPILRKVDDWIPGPLAKAAELRAARAQKLLDLDEAVASVMEKLKERGFRSPYLRAFVVARINPLRFMKDKIPKFDDLLATMTKRARGMDAGRIKQEDIARTGGPPEATEEGPS
ncbi:MAG TPA: chromosome partitioning protein ParB [Polyangia bacterium]